MKTRLVGTPDGLNINKAPRAGAQDGRYALHYQT